MEFNLESLLKLYGPLGLGFGLMVLLVWKKLLPYIEKQRAEYQAVLTSALEDARNERDLMRQLREQEVTKFLESLRYRDAEFKAVADAISSVKRQR
jgi:F0F1-type ATP synthase membrane subunit b/b'